MNKVGFIILTHANTEQNYNLLRILNENFDYPNIAWHHDFSKSKLQTERLTSNVKLVENWVVTSWGGFSLVEAKMLALRELYTKFKNKTRFYTTLSAADIPLKNQYDIVEDLLRDGSDVFIKSSLITPNNLKKKWQKSYYKRYCAPKILFRYNNKNNVNVIGQIPLNTLPIIDRLFTPFTETLNCWAGEFWYTGTDKAAEYLLDYFTSDKDGIIKHYKNTKIPDESIFQTIFNNTRELQSSNNNFRYIDWSEGNPHPKILTDEDHDSILASGAHFARKLDLVNSSKLYNLIEERLKV